jgi:hypothetical protein
MQNTLVPEIEHWFKSKFNVEGFMIVRKDKIQTVEECEFRDVLVLGSEETTSPDLSIPSIPKIKPKGKNKKMKELNQNVEEVEKKTPKKSKKKNQDSCAKLPEDVSNSTTESQIIQPKVAKLFDNPKLPQEVFTTSNESNGHTKPNNDFKKFRCPDSKCLFTSNTANELLIHLPDEHSLKCKMPYCTFSCYNFNDYLLHFEYVHCLTTPLPAKRTSVDPQTENPKKAIKLTRN